MYKSSSNKQVELPNTHVKNYTTNTSENQKQNQNSSPLSLLKQKVDYNHLKSNVNTVDPSIFSTKCTNITQEKSKPKKPIIISTISDEGDDQKENATISQEQEEAVIEKPIIADYKRKPVEQPDEEFKEIELTPCSNCGRNFAISRIERHLRACKKQKRRTEFDSKQQRITKDMKEAPVSSTVYKKQRFPKWKVQHLAFRHVLGGMSIDDVEELDDRIKCEYCGRKFSEAAAERHIPICKTAQLKQLQRKKLQANSRRIV